MSGELDLYFQFIGQLALLAGLYVAASEIYKGASESFKNWRERRIWRKRNV